MGNGQPIIRRSIRVHRQDQLCEKRDVLAKQLKRFTCTKVFHQLNPSLPFLAKRHNQIKFTPKFPTFLSFLLFFFVPRGRCLTIAASREDSAQPKNNSLRAKLPNTKDIANKIKDSNFSNHLRGQNPKIAHAPPTKNAKTPFHEQGAKLYLLVKRALTLLSGLKHIHFRKLLLHLGHITMFANACQNNLRTSSYNQGDP